MIALDFGTITKVQRIRIFNSKIRSVLGKVANNGSTSNGVNMVTMGNTVEDGYGNLPTILSVF